MLSQGLRVLAAGLAPRLQQAGAAISAAASKHPMLTTALGAGAASAAANAIPPTARNSARDRWYGGVETHKPHDAYDAYQEDDFLKQAFQTAPDYDTYSNMLKKGGVGSDIGLTPDEFDELVKNPTAAKEYMIPEREINKRLNEDMFGEGWEDQVEQDAYRIQQRRKRMLALQQAGK